MVLEIPGGLFGQNDVRETEIGVTVAIGDFCSIYKYAGNQFLTNDAEVAITFDGEISDVKNLHDPSTNNERINVGQGTYLVTASILWTCPNDSLRVVFRLYQGALEIQRKDTDSDPSIIQEFETTITEIVKVDAASTYFKLTCEPDISNSMDLLGGAIYQTKFSVMRLK